jgi:uncharacterized membrane protein YsdA (DUF1294 family)
MAYPLALGPAHLALAGAYVAASLTSFALYGLDKAAARRATRRIPEVALHLVALAGGWPGALLAQAVFRHKTVKRPFRIAFLCTVFVNCLGLLWILERLASVPVR